MRPAEMPALDTSTSTGTLVLLDLLEGAVDGFVVGDVALDAEQPVRCAGSAVRDGHFVTVGRKAL